MNNSLKTVFAFTVGIGAGLVTGYLTAPRSGKKTRDKFAKDMQDAKKSVEKSANKKLEEARKMLNEQINEQVNRGKTALNKLKDKVTIPG